MQKHRLTETLSLVPRRARVRAAGECRFPLVCTRAHVPTARSGAETAQGGAPAIPTLIGRDKKSTYNADNNNNKAAPGTYRLYCGVYTSLARRRLPAVARIGCTQQYQN